MARKRRDRWEIRSYTTVDGAVEWSANFWHSEYGRGKAGFGTRNEAVLWALGQDAQMDLDADRCANRPHQMSLLEII